VRRIRRQFSIAALAARSDFQHSALQTRSYSGTSVPFLTGAVKAIQASTAESRTELDVRVVEWRMTFAIALR
jgi:hypothetical protein